MTRQERRPELLAARDIHKSFATADGPLPVLCSVDLSLEKGESLALTGESGSGKSTLLHILGALESADSGRVEILGQEITGASDRQRGRLRRETIGLVFQQFNLIPSLSAGENLRFQARLAGREDPAWSAELARRLGLTEHLGRYPDELSGGQQQRLAIGRALAARPALLLADEPTGNLDETTAGAVMALMLELVAETRTALLMVTHSEKLAARLSRRMHLAAGRLRPA